MFVGDVTVGDRLTIQWTNATAISCPRTGHPQVGSKLALWLLDAPEGGLYRGNFPEYTIVLDPSDSRLREFERELRGSVNTDSSPPIVRQVIEFLSSREWLTWGLGGQQSNNSVNPTVRPVTPRACARVAPVRPAGYAER